MLTNQKITKLHVRLPEIQNRLKNITHEIIKLSRKQVELAKFCRFINKLTEIYEDVPLEIGPHFARALSSEYTRYTYYRTHPEDIELRVKSMRWIVDFIDHPPANPDGTTNYRVACVIDDVKNYKTAIELSRLWILRGQEWLDKHNA